MDYHRSPTIVHGDFLMKQFLCWGQDAPNVAQFVSVLTNFETMPLDGCGVKIVSNDPPPSGGPAPWTPIDKYLLSGSYTFQRDHFSQAGTLAIDNAETCRRLSIFLQVQPTWVDADTFDARGFWWNEERWEVILYN